MADDLLRYYERELSFIREMGAEFARRYPRIADRLQLEAESCQDPHTERLIEAFCFLSARLHKRIDDHFPEITESLLQVLYPHYLSPIPSMAVVAFEVMPQAVPPSGYRIGKNTPLFSKPVQGTPCQFSTGYEVTLWPITVTSAAFAEVKKAVTAAHQVLSVTLSTASNGGFCGLSCRSLRFFINGGPQQVHDIYELILNHTCHIELSWVNRQGKRECTALAPADLSAVGFGEADALLPYDGRTCRGYRLLFEYFSFPEKFLFFELHGLDRLRGTDAGDALEISLYLDRRAREDLVLDKETFRLNATPIVNLFRTVAEPIRIDHRRTRYRVIPDLRRSHATEVFAVERVASSGIGPGHETAYRPLYSMDHHGGADATCRAYWHAMREPSGRDGDDGTDLYLSFLDLEFNPAQRGDEVVQVKVTCTNRDLPSRIPVGDPGGDFESELSAPVAAIRSLVKPTPPRRPAPDGKLQWRLISHLALNHLSLLERDGEALKEILRLYDFCGSAANRQQIDGIANLRWHRVTKRIGKSFCRGVEVHITFDEEKFVGTGPYLFASVIESFLGHYVSINSFVRLVAETLQRKEKLKEWPARNGERILL